MDFVKKIIRTPLFRVTSLNGISVLIKIAIGLLTSKVIAVFVGPAGMALVGNLRNFITSVENTATLGFQHGIIKYIAENRENETELRKITATVFWSLLLAALVLSGLLFLFSEYWSQMVFGTNSHYRIVIKAFALALPWYAVSLFSIAVINGLGKFRQVIYINIIGNVIGLIVSVLLIWQYQTLGALLAVVIAPALLFLVSFYVLNREFPFARQFPPGLFDVAVVRNLSHYSLMTLVSVVLGPLVLLAIRRKVITVTGIDAAGHWEAMTRISSYYLLFISTILTVYFLPKLAIAKDVAATRRVFSNYFSGLMPVFMTGLFVVYLLRHFIIKILFTDAFAPVADLFFWQLSGDVLKAASMVLGYQLFAQKHTAAFVVTEVFSLGVLYFSSVFFVTVIGIEGVVIAHAFTYFIYLIVLAIHFRKSLF